MNFDQITSSIQGDDSNSLGLNGYFISVEKIASTSITSVFNSGLDTPYPGENNSGDFFVNKFTDENFVKIQYSYNLSESKIDIGGKTYQLQASAPNVKAQELKNLLIADGINAFTVSSDNIIGLPLSDFSDYIDTFNLDGDVFLFLGNPTDHSGELGNFEYTPDVYFVGNSEQSSNLTEFSQEFVEGIDFLTKPSTGINLVDQALQIISSQRASLDLLSNRLDHIIANNKNASTNTKASLGRIQDADFAAEKTILAKSKIREQSSTAMLAQANVSVYEVLTLIPD